MKAGIAVKSPGILYKYRADSQFTESILVDRKVWLATAETLNDPLECRAGVIPVEESKAVIEQFEVAQLMGMFGMPPRVPFTLFSLNPRQTKAWFRKFKKLSHDQQVQAMRKVYADHGMQLSNPRKIFERFEEQLSSVGVFSMTSLPTNMPMWAHYGAGHEGLAIGFSTTDPRSKLADQKHTMQVAYSDHRPVFDGRMLHEIQFFMAPTGVEAKGSFAFDDKFLKQCFATKTLHWSYEEEWRYVEASSGLYPVPGEIVEIIFGLKMPESRKEHYANLSKVNWPGATLLAATKGVGGEISIQPWTPPA